jgi:hypothetical protein
MGVLLPASTLFDSPISGHPSSQAIEAKKRALLTLTTSLVSTEQITYRSTKHHAPLRINGWLRSYRH